MTSWNILLVMPDQPSVAMVHHEDVLVTTLEPPPEVPVLVQLVAGGYVTALMSDLKYQFLSISH